MSSPKREQALKRHLKQRCDFPWILGGGQPSELPHGDYGIALIRDTHAEQFPDSHSETSLQDTATGLGLVGLL